MSLSPYLHYATSASTIHVLSYSTLFGATLFQTFIVGPVQFKTVPRQQFGNIQARLTPIYFTLQSITGAVCLFTSYNSTAGTYNELLALGTSTVASIVNLLLVGPATTKVMQKRHKLERQTDTKYTDAVVSDEMAKLNTEFNWIHSVGAGLNVIGFIALIAHGIHLGHKINLLEPY